MQRCLLKLIVDKSLTDSMSDTLLAYPKHELVLTSYVVQAHHQTLDKAADIRELVSGFKQKIMFEITLRQDEARAVYQYVKEQMPHVELQAQLLPLLDLES